MAWRDDIAGYAKNGDVAGVLKIFDELWNDRARRIASEAALLQHVAELKGGGKPLAPKTAPAAANYDKLEAAFNRLTKAAQAHDPN
jgi:hypothetical protein